MDLEKVIRNASTGLRTGPQLLRTGTSGEVMLDQNEGLSSALPVIRGAMLIGSIYTTIELIGPRSQAYRAVPQLLTP